MGSITKRVGKKGTTYRAQVLVDGKRLGESFPNKKSAVAWVNHMETQKNQGKYIMPTEAKQRTVGELLDRHLIEVVPHLKSERNRRREILRWKELLGGEKLYSLGADQILKARAQIQLQETRDGNLISNSSVNRYMAALNHALSIAVNQYEWIESNPMKSIPKLKEPKWRDRYLYDNERERLLDACRKDPNPIIYEVVMMAINTGMRKQEMLDLKWKNVLFDQSLIIVDESKNGSKRSIPITSALRPLLQELFERNAGKSKYVFPSKNNLRPMDIKSAWQRVIKAAEIRDFRFHDLRHTAASYLAMNGASVPQIAKVLGHKSFQMAARYAHLSDASTSAILENTMAGKFEGDIK